MSAAPAPSAPGAREPLFTSRFLVMCGFSFAVFFSIFQFVPTAPFRVAELGGGTLAAGLFLGGLTLSSAVSSPFTGVIADRIGRRLTLLVASAIIGGITLQYAWLSSFPLMIALVVVHGVFWSALLNASAAHLTNLIPVQRRAEGLAYWGLSSVIATAAAPPVAFWMMARGGWPLVCLACTTLNAVMFSIAWTLHDPRPTAAAPAPGAAIEWRVLVLAVTLFLYSFGYGAITGFSAVYADALQVSPKSLYLTTIGIVMLLTRPFSGRIADRFGYRRVLLPALAAMALGLALLTFATARVPLVVSAAFFGLGFGTAYPVFVAYVMRDISDARRGAAFGAVLAAFDTGIGAGSIGVGWLIQRFGFGAAFGTAAVLSAIALPYFVLADRHLRKSEHRVIG
jgi:MFS family permease